MSHKINYAAYVQLLDEDLEWLRSLPRTLEREHVILIVEKQKDRDTYERIPAPWPPE